MITGTVFTALTVTKLIVTATSTKLAANLLVGRLLGDVVAWKRADTAGAAVYADTPAVVIATHHSDEVSLA